MLINDLIKHYLTGTHHTQEKKEINDKIRQCKLTISRQKKTTTATSTGIENEEEKFKYR